MDKISTKEKIVLAAFDLFAEKGYDGVGVDQIAEAVGIKGPSLYHHFKSKEEILNALIERNEIYYETHFGLVAKMDNFPQNVDDLVELSMKRINVTIHDENIKKARMFMTMEQFRNPEIRELTTKHFLTGLEELYTVLFSHMMKDGIIKEDDPRMLAFEFVAPITMLVHLIDRQPEKEAETLIKMEQFMRHFIDMHKS